MLQEALAVNNILDTNGLRRRCLDLAAPEHSEAVQQLAIAMREVMNQVHDESAPTPLLPDGTPTCACFVCDARLAVLMVQSLQKQGLL